MCNCSPPSPFSKVESISPYQCVFALTEDEFYNPIQVIKPSCFIKVRGIFSIWQVFTRNVKLRLHSSLPREPRVIKLLSGEGRRPPLCFAIYWRASAIPFKILGADLRPKGRAVSTYRWPFHSIPRRWWSCGCIGTFWKVLFTLILARRVPGPSVNICCTTSPTFM